HFGFRSLQEHVKQVTQKGIADIERGFEIVPAFGERLCRIKKWPPVRSTGGSGNAARYSSQEFQPRLATLFIRCKIEAPGFGHAPRRHTRGEEHLRFGQ